MTSNPPCKSTIRTQASKLLFFCHCVFIALIAMGAACGPAGDEPNLWGTVPSASLEDESVRSGQTPSKLTSPTIFVMNKDNVLARIDPQTLIVRFYYRYAGQELPYEKMVEGEVIALPIEGQPNAYQLTFKKMLIGEVHNQKMMICDRFEMEGLTQDFGCDAIFFNYSHHPAPDSDGVYRKTYHMLISTATIPTVNYFSFPHGSATFYSQGKKIDLSADALKQINQYGTGTCLFNSATGILEWYYHRQYGKSVDLSEPALVVSSELGSMAEYEMMEKTNLLYSVIPDNAMPVTDYYYRGATFNTVQDKAAVDLEKARKTTNQHFKLPFTLKEETLFWYGRWNKGQTKEEDFQKAVNWLKEKQQPVHLYHEINGYWHAVIMLGYDPKTSEVLIKDSLGQTNLVGTWRSKKWFMDYTYGASGIKLKTQNSTASITSSTAQPSTYTPSLSVDVKFGTLEGGLKAFQLYLKGSAADLKLVKQVTYDIHPSFSTQYSVATEYSNHFASNIYRTYASGWKTGMATIQLKDGRELKVQGVVVSW